MKPLWLFGYIKEFTRELRRLGVSMNQIAAKAHSLGFVDELEYAGLELQFFKTVENDEVDRCCRNNKQKQIDQTDTQPLAAPDGDP